MFPSLEAKRERHDELAKLLEDPESTANIDRLLEIQKEMGVLAKVGKAVGEFHEMEGDIDAARRRGDEQTCAGSKTEPRSETGEQVHGA